LTCFTPLPVLDPHVMGLLEKDAHDASVGLHVLWDERDGFLTADGIARQVPEWRDADVWFCGPNAFGHALKKDFMDMGLPAGRFHQELFEMR
jgi:predicted ferric reductase